MSKAILKNLHFDEQFKLNGFLKLKLITPSIIAGLAKIYADTKEAHETVAKSNPFHSTQDTYDEDLVRYIDKEVKRLLLVIVEQHFQNHQVLISNFLIKEPIPESELRLHQDWNFVDEIK